MSACRGVILPVLTIGLVLFFLRQTVVSILQRAEGNLVTKWGYHLYPNAEENPSSNRQGWFEYFGFSDSAGPIHYNSIELYSETGVFLLMLSMGIISVRTILQYFNNRSATSFKSLAHVVPPKTFTTTTDVDRWLEAFELYLEAHNVQQQRQKCNALLSRLDNESADLVKNYIDEDDSIMLLLTANKGLECYRTLREAMLKLFGKVHVGTTAAQSQFVARAQGKEENIHRYYSNLKNLSKIAFPTLTPSQRKELNDTRFVDGINSDELRQKILLMRKATNQCIVKKTLNILFC